MVSYNKFVIKRQPVDFYKGNHVRGLPFGCSLILEI